VLTATQALIIGLRGPFQELLLDDIARSADRVSEQVRVQEGAVGIVPSRPSMYASLVWLSLGAFAIGTETFMISGILPGMALDLGVSVEAAGQLVTIFAFAYATGSPLIAVATASLSRRNLLIGAMAVFAFSNLLAALAPGYAVLAFARVLLAIAAGTFMPASASYASMTNAPERRGRALAFVYSGMTISLVLGVPLGTLLASRLNWRATFGGVAVLSFITLAGIVAKLRPVPNPPAAGLAQRFAVAHRPDVLAILTLSMLLTLGTFTVQTYLGAYLEAVFEVSPQGVAFCFFSFGVASACGNALGGYAADRWDTRRYLLVVLMVMASAFGSITGLAGFAPAPWALVGVVFAILAWGVFGWSWPSVQQFRLLAVDAQLAPITLSLNASAMYFGVALGAALGAATIRLSSLAMIGLTGAVCVLVAFVFLARTGRSVSSPTQPEPPGS